MAKLRAKAILDHASGMVGDLIFRQHFGQTIVQLRAKRKDRPATPAQAERRAQFQNAMVYAKTVLDDPLQQEHYRALARERGCPPNSLLISNFLTLPTVDRIEDAGYQGKPGDIIKVLASDDIEVVAVTVALRNITGTMLEEGPAVKIHGIWVYTATTSVPAGQPLLIEAAAIDRPGNKAKQTKVRA